MNKTLRFSLLSMLMMLCGTMFADDVTVTFTAGTDVGTQTNAGAGADEMSKDGITISVTKGALAAAQYRTAKGETMTITSSVGNITKVVFTCTASDDAQYGPGNFTDATTGSYTYEGKVGTWTGNAASFSLTASSAQVRATSIVVTVGEGSDDGGGDDPVTPDPEVQTVANIAAFKALAAKTEAELTLTNAEVLYVNGTNDIYVRDATGAIDFFRSGLTYTAGQKLNGSVIGVYDLYNNTPELVKSDNTNDSKITATSGTVTAKSINAADAANYLCDLVKFTGVTLTEADGKYYVGDVQIYDKFKVVSGTPSTSTSYDIEGIIIMYGDVVEICPIKDYTTGTTPDPDDPDDEVQTVANIAAFKALATGTEAELTLTDAEVLYVNGTNDMYVRDATGAIDFYRTDLTFTAGQKLNGSVIGKYDVFKNTPELVKSDNTNDSKITATSGTVTAKSIDATEAANYICDLVKFSGVKLTNMDGKFYVADVQVYDKFKVVSGTPDETTSYDIEGILIMYGDVIEICPVKDYTDGTTPDPGEDEIITATIAEFNAAAESTDVWYKLSGEVSNLKDGDQYGNFDLTDASGSVYVYGLLSEKGGEKKQFQALAAEKGIKNGCKITIIGNRGSYKDKIEVMNAYFVSVDEAAPAELVISGEAEFVESTTVTITPSDVDHDVYYTLDGSDPSDYTTATRYTEPFVITETCTVRAWEEDTELFAEKTFTKVGTEAETITVEDVIAAAPESTTAADGQQKVWVKGYIVGYVNGQAYDTGAVFGVEGCEVKTNLLLASWPRWPITDPAETDVTKCVPVQLPSGDVRNALNLQENPDNYGKEVKVLGYVLKYFNVPGVKNVTAYEFTGNTSVELQNVETLTNGKKYNVAGQRVNDNYKGIVIMNGKKFMVK
ncbi:MAG: DUF6359 domain-containing protein [Prevotella sp.]|nr:DUF6359 domain-containing protein [Prevotella sp.]